MVDQKRIIELVNKFGDDVANNEASREELRSMGRDIVKILYTGHFQTDGQTYIEIYKTLAAIGNDLFAANGAENIENDILKAMQSGAKKSRLWADDEVFYLSIESLTRWGVTIPSVTDQEVHTCHVCGKKLTEERIHVCGLHRCNNAVCREHAHIIETRFGAFDGSGGAWFCTAEHLSHANQNHIDWN